MFAAQVRTQPAFAVGNRTPLFVAPYRTSGTLAAYDVHPDGQHFVFVKLGGDEAPDLILVQNLFSAGPRAAGGGKEP